VAVNALYADRELVLALTKQVLAEGDTIFQIERLAPTEEEHVDLLLKFFRPKHNARILDAGCGVGGVAALAGRVRADLSFVLLNASAEQLTLSVSDAPLVVGDMNAMPLPDECVDATMVCYALGHADPKKFMAEAARVTRPGGHLYIYDLFGTSDFVKQVLMYDVQPLVEFLHIADAHWRPFAMLAPPTFREHFYKKLDATVCDQMFREVQSVLISLERK
jgi:ubiquinone/menaquinone biosynthesis C-methylase UbiE